MAGYLRNGKGSSKQDKALQGMQRLFFAFFSQKIKNQYVCITLIIEKAGICG